MLGRPKIFLFEYLRHNPVGENIVQRAFSMLGGMAFKYSLSGSWLDFSRALTHENIIAEWFSSISATLGSSPQMRYSMPWLSSFWSFILF